MAETRANGMAIAVKEASWFIALTWAGSIHAASATPIDIQPPTFPQRRRNEICAWSGVLGPKVREGDRQARDRIDRAQHAASQRMIGEMQRHALFVRAERRPVRASCVTTDVLSPAVTSHRPALASAAYSHDAQKADRKPSTSMSSTAMRSSSSTAAWPQESSTATRVGGRSGGS